MSKNKKPRKKYVKKPHIPAWTKVEKESLDVIASLISEVEEATEFKLPRGTCRDAELFIIRDFINWAIVASATRSWYTEQSSDEATEILAKGTKAIVEVQYRGRKNGFHFICTAKELNLIRDCVEFVASFARESLRDCPMRLEKEWNVMRAYSDHAKRGQPVFASIAELKKAIQNA